MEKYQKIINSFLKGSVEGIAEKGIIPEHIETQISHLFLFPKTVYKICKRDNKFFNDHFRNLADLKTRIHFYKADFFENNYFSPEVYLNVYGVVVDDNNNNNVIIGGVVDGDEDIVMKMNRVNLDHNLSHILHEKKLNEDDFKIMGYQQTKEVALYPHQPKTKESYYDIFQRRLDDVRDWMYSAPTYFSKEKTDEIIEIMRNYVERKKIHFIEVDTNNYVVSLDNHSDNIFYENKKMFFLDIYPPKEDWMVVAPWLNIYRPATDIHILMGEKYSKSFLQGYKDYYGSLDESHELFYFLYSAAIQGVSLFNLSKNNEMKFEDSVIYKDFILKSAETLKNK